MNVETRKCLSVIAIAPKKALTTQFGEGNFLLSDFDAVGSTGRIKSDSYDAAKAAHTEARRIVGVLTEVALKDLTNKPVNAYQRKVCSLDMSAAIRENIPTDTKVTRKSVQAAIRTLLGQVLD